MSNTLNKKEREILDFIVKSTDTGIMPTVRDICAEFGYNSTSTANKYINTLCEKGYIEKNPNHKRNIKLKCHKLVCVPLIDIKNYTPDFLDSENISEYISWTPDREYDYPLFAFRMSEAYNDIIGINDIVIAERTFHDGRKYYLEENMNSLHITEKHSLKCIGRIVSVIKYL